MAKNKANRKSTTANASDIKADNKVVGQTVKPLIKELDDTNKIFIPEPIVPDEIIAESPVIEPKVTYGKSPNIKRRVMYESSNKDVGSDTDIDIED